MDDKGRTFRFRACKESNKWQVLVFVQGCKGVERFHQIKIIGDIRGKYQAYCNCPKKWYAKNKGEQCHHEKEFMLYMEKLIKEGRAKV